MSTCVVCQDQGNISRTGGVVVKNTGPILAEIETFLEDHERDIIDFACKLVATPSENPR